MLIARINDYYYQAGLKTSQDSSFSPSCGRYSERAVMEVTPFVSNACSKDHNEAGFVSESTNTVDARVWYFTRVFCEMNIYALEGHNRGMGIRTIAYRYDDVMCVHSLVLYAGLRARVQVFELASYRFRCEQLQF